MARKYARDNRGRFASSGSGATARGGRLKTASGGQRATQKRMIISAETRKLAPASVDAASKSGKINLSRKYGGQGQGYKSRLGLSAAKAAKTAQEASRASIRRSGLPKSGGAMRLGSGVGAAKVRAKAALNREKIARAAYFKTDFGTKAQAVAKSKLDKATKKADAKRNQMRAAKMARMDASVRKPMSARRTKAAAPANTVANKTGQSKTLNKFNSRPERTRGAYVGGRYVDKSKLSGRQPLDLGRSDDRAFGRVATKAARSRAAAAKPAAKPAAKVNLSQAAFERRAKITEKRARAAEKTVAGIDRFNTSNRRAFRTADALRSAADSYASYARRGKNNPDFTAADLFKGRARRSTAPKLSKSEKAAATRRANADKRFRENVRRMEADRRRR